jgi:adenosine deaminase
LAQFLEKFEIFLPLVAGDKDALERVAYEFVEDQASQGIIYTETRYSPHYLMGTSLTVKQVRHSCRTHDPDHN